MTSNYDIFISYKRKSLPTANNLYYRLTTRGYSTFFDLEEMGRDNFNIQLLNYIENAKDVFVILEEGSLDACKKGDWEKDWFCHEIAFALEKKKNIIPILLGDYKMPSTDFFPEKLKELSLKNAPEFNFSFFEAYLDKLIEKDYLLSKPNLQEKATSVFKFYSNENCQVFKDGKLVCSLEGKSDEPYFLPVSRKGDYRFKVVNDVSRESRIVDEIIDSVEEKRVEIKWKRKRIKEFSILTKKTIVIKKRRYIDICEKGKDNILRILRDLNRTCVLLCFSVVLIVIFILGVIQIRKEDRSFVIDKDKFIQDAIRIDNLQNLAYLLDSVKPDEVGALFDNVLYYKKNKLYFFVDSVGTPIGKGEPFDSFIPKGNVILTERRIPKSTKNQTLHYGLISAKGNELLPCNNVVIEDIAGVHCFKKDSLWGCVNDTMEILNNIFSSMTNGGYGLLLCYNYNDKYVYYTKEGQRRLPLSRDTIFYYAEKFSSGYALVKDEPKGPMFYIDTIGDRWYLRGNYDILGSFIYGMARVGKKEKNNIKVGLLDKNFNEVLPCKYDWISQTDNRDPFNKLAIGNNAAIVRQDSTWKIIDFNQSPISYLSKKGDDSFFKGLNRNANYLPIKENVQLYNDFIRIDNKLFINNHCVPNRYEYMRFNNDFVTCSKDNDYIIYAKSGKKVGPFDYVEVFGGSEYKQTGIRVKSIKGLYGLLDKDLNLLIKCEFKNIGAWSPLGLFPAIKDSLFGYIDMKGKWIIPDVYEYASAFYDGYAIVKRDGKYGIIDHQGSKSIPFDFDEITARRLNLYVVRKGGKYGIVCARTKKQIIPCEFDNDFKYITANRFPIKKDGKWGFYTNDGRNSLELSKTVKKQKNVK